MPTHDQRIAQKREHGVALVVSLIILIIVTLLSITAMRSANLDTRIAVNHQHRQLAFQAAENALTKLTVLPAEEMSTLKVPGTKGSIESNANWFHEDSSTDKPGTSANLDLELLDISRPGQYKFSGYGLNIRTVLFQADAFGSVDDTSASAHNRMEVALIRE